MPNEDQTGPEGMGPKTGLQDGDCADNDAPRSGKATVGRGHRGQRGRSHRQRRYFCRHGRRFGRGRLTQEQQAEALKSEAAWLQERLDTVNQQIEEIAG